MAKRVLVVDDEKGIREALRNILEDEGFQVKTSDSGSGALRAYTEYRPHLVLLDVKMAGLDGLQTLERIREQEWRSQVVMISGHGTIQTAVEATQMGAYDFLEKPLDTDRILLTLRHALEHATLESENQRLRESFGDRYAIVGDSAAMDRLREVIEKVAPTGARVLITGPNGSGKELVARAIHRGSPRVDQPFVEVNCAAIPSELIESELFGHMKDMSAAAQSKVLRALEEGKVTRIGATKPITIDVRVIAATNKVVEEEIEAGRFREDLYYRLNVVPIEVPPLRDRREDVKLLIAKFAADLARDHGVGPKPFHDDAIRALESRDWPGNVRELRNAVERLLVLTVGDAVTAADVERLSGVSDDATVGNLIQYETFEEFKLAAERAFLETKLSENNWNVSETARKLDMPRSNLYKKIEKYGLERG
jgi:two-component system nitrogen regulation response regulator NtrX